jgi:hypothetical protein
MCVQALSSCDLLRYWHSEEIRLLRERGRRDSIQIADLTRAVFTGAFSPPSITIPVTQACYAKGAGAGAALTLLVEHALVRPALRRAR